MSRTNIALALLLASGSIACVLLALGPLFSATGSSAQPSAVVEGHLGMVTHAPMYVFGYSGGPQQFDLPVENFWKEEIHIDTVTTSCSCGAAELRDSTLPRGGESSMLLTVDFGASGGEKELQCVLSAPTGHQLVHRVRAFAYPPLQAETDLGVVSFGSLRPRASASQNVSIAIRSARGEKLPTITSIDCASDAVDLEQGESSPALYIAEGNGIESRLGIQLHLVTDDEPGSYATELHIRYMLEEEEREWTLPITWQVVPVLVVSPPRLFLRSTSTQERLSRKIRLSTRDEKPFSVLSLASGADWLNAELETPGTADAHSLRLTIDPKQLEADSHTLLSVSTDHPDQPLITIPISVAAARRSIAPSESAASLLEADISATEK